MLPRGKGGSMQHVQKLHMRLHGTYSLSWGDGTAIMLKSAKARGLLAMLASAPGGRQARATIQRTLWGSTGPEHQQASLRRCISELRKALASGFDAIISQDAFCVTMNLEQVIIDTGPRDGPFLEDLNIRESTYLDWVEGERKRAVRSLRGAQGAAANPAFATLVVLPMVALDGHGDTSNLPLYVTKRLAQLLSRWREVNVVHPLDLSPADLARLDLSALSAETGADHVIHGTFALHEESRSYTLTLDITDTRTGQIREAGTKSGRVTSLLADHSAALEEAVGTVIATINRMRIERGFETSDGNARDHFSHAMANLFSGTADALTRGRRSLDAALSMASDVAHYHGWSARWSLLARSRALPYGSDNPLAKARTAIHRGLLIDPRNTTCLVTQGWIELLCDDGLPKALDILDSAHFVDPRDPWAEAGLALAVAAQGEKERALGLAQDARRKGLALPYGAIFEQVLAWVSLMTGDNTQAANAAWRALRTDRYDLQSMLVRIVAQVRHDALADARRECQSMMQRHPGITIGVICGSLPLAGLAGRLGIAEALAEAGLPGATDFGTVVGFAEDPKR